jgi:hypothetical protein
MSKWRSIKRAIAILFLTAAAGTAIWRVYWFSNPVIGKPDIRDPTAIGGDDGQFVLTATADNGTGPLFTLRHSANLIDWHVDSKNRSVFPRSPLSASRERWSPDFSKTASGYSLFYSAEFTDSHGATAQRLYVTTTPRLSMAAWSDPIPVLDRANDPFLYIDSDLKQYLFWTSDPGAGSLNVAPVNETLAVSQQAIVTVDDIRNLGRSLANLGTDSAQAFDAIHGPFVIRPDAKGYYYLIYSAGHESTQSCNSRLYVQRTTNLLNPKAYSAPQELVHDSKTWWCYQTGSIVPVQNRLYLLYSAVRKPAINSPHQLLVSEVRFQHGWPKLAPAAPEAWARNPTHQPRLSALKEEGFLTIAATLLTGAFLLFLTRDDPRPQLLPTLREEMRLTHETLKILQPSDPPRVQGIDVGCAIQRSEVPSAVIYGYHENDRTLAIWLVEPEGRGLAAIKRCVALYKSLHEHWRSTSPEYELSNADIAARGSEFLSSSRALFVANMTVVDQCSMRLEHANAGMPSLLIFHGGDLYSSVDFDKRDAFGIPIGLGPPETSRNRISSRLQPGDVLVLTSWGVTEACDRGGLLLGNSKIYDIVRRTWHKPAYAICNAILRSSIRHCPHHHPQDDQLVLVIKMNSANSNLHAPAGRNTLDQVVEAFNAQFPHISSLESEFEASASPVMTRREGGGVNRVEYVYSTEPQGVTTTAYTTVNGIITLQVKVDSFARLRARSIRDHFTNAYQRLKQETPGCIASCVVHLLGPSTPTALIYGLLDLSKQIGAERTGARLYLVGFHPAYDEAVVNTGLDKMAFNFAPDISAAWEAALRSG